MKWWSLSYNSQRLLLQVISVFVLCFGLTNLSMASPQSQLSCEAYTLYREAGNQSLRGQRAVLDVLANRINNNSSTCLKQVAIPKQFSWHIGKNQRFPLTKEMLDRYLEVLYASPVLSNEYEYFYAASIAKPKWAYKMHCRKIDSQYYCRK